MMTSDWSITHVSNLQTYIQLVLACPNTDDTKRVSATYRELQLQIGECYFGHPTITSNEIIIASNIAIIRINKPAVGFMTKSSITIKVTNETKSMNIIFKVKIPIAFIVNTAVIYPYAIDYNMESRDLTNTIIVIPSEVVASAMNQIEIPPRRDIKTELPMSQQTVNINAEGLKYHIDTVQNCESYLKITMTCGLSGKKSMRVQHEHEGVVNRLKLAEYLPNGSDVYRVRYDSDDIKLQTDYPTIHILTRGNYVHVGDTLHVRIRNSPYHFDVFFVIKVPSKGVIERKQISPHAIKQVVVSTNQSTYTSGLSGNNISAVQSGNNVVAGQSGNNVVSTQSGNNVSGIRSGIPSTLQHAFAPITLKQRSDQDTATVFRRELLKNHKIPSPDSFKIPPPLTASGSIVLPVNVESLGKSASVQHNVEETPKEISAPVQRQTSAIVETQRVNETQHVTEASTSNTQSASTSDNSNPYSQQKLKRQHDDLSESIEKLEAELRIKRKRLQATNEIIKSVVAADALIAKLNSLN